MMPIKLRIAFLIDRWFPTRYCWAELVGWALGSLPFGDIGSPNQCEGSYCGKCALVKK